MACYIFTTPHRLFFRLTPSPERLRWIVLKHVCSPTGQIFLQYPPPLRWIVRHTRARVHVTFINPPIACATARIGAKSVRFQGKYYPRLCADCTPVSLQYIMPLGLFNSVERFLSWRFIPATHTSKITTATSCKDGDSTKQTWERRAHRSFPNLLERAPQYVLTLATRRCNGAANSGWNPVRFDQPDFLNATHTVWPKSRHRLKQHPTTTAVHGPAADVETFGDDRCLAGGRRLLGGITFVCKPRLFRTFGRSGVSRGGGGGILKKKQDFLGREMASFSFFVHVSARWLRE